MKIGDRQVGLMHPPYVIAEIGVNHDGDVDRASRLVELARESDADAVKFQYFTADCLMSKASRLAAYQAQQGEKDPTAMLRRLQLSLDDLAGLIDRAHAIGLHAIVTTFSLEHVAASTRLEWDAFKIASPDVINLPLIEQIRAAGRPVIVSTGAAERSEIETVIRRGLGDAYMHCVSAYPTPDERAQLGGVAALNHLIEEVTGSDSTAAEYPAVGYSDHTASEQTGALAVACGASLLEKHFTDDRSRSGPDHSASLQPQEFREYVATTRHAWKMIGERRILVQEIERDVRSLCRQSIVTTRFIRAGETISRSDLTIKRPGTGLAPRYLNELPGCVALHDIDMDTPIPAEAVELKKAIKV